MPEPEPRFSYLEMEAAMCVWECLNDWTLPPATKRTDWIELREAVGSAELRHASIELGQWSLKVHELCTRRNPDIFDGFAYDWEVIPDILEHARDASGPVIYEAALPAVAQTAAKVFLKYWRQQWLVEARFAAQQAFGYGDLVSDHPESAERAFLAREKPADWVEWIGEKYNLARTSRYG